MIRFVTAGESHGKELTVILEGVPAGLKLSAKDINKDLARRQLGYGRGSRMQIEKDAVEFTAGVRHGATIGSPICMVIKNRDWGNWKSIMASDPVSKHNEIQLRPRPGHADLTGIMKYGSSDIRDILERASARETAARVAAGSVCKRFLSELGINVWSFTREIAGIMAIVEKLNYSKLSSVIEKSELRTTDKNAEAAMKEAIKEAGEAGDTVGGVFTVVAQHVPVGLGSHTQWDLKLDGNIARSIISIQAIKAVEFGLGRGYSSTLGSEAHDELFYSKNKGFYRDTNNAGGIEGGMSNGEDIVVECVMKPIPSLKKPLRSVNIRTKKETVAEAVRSDVCAVPAAGVIGEAAVAIELSKAIKEKFGGDSMLDIMSSIKSYITRIKRI